LLKVKLQGCVNSGRVFEVDKNLIYEASLFYMRSENGFEIEIAGKL